MSGGAFEQFELTEAEWDMVKHLPELDLVDLAAELELIPPAEIDRRSLVVQCVLRMVVLAQEDGLPFSKYDRDDLDALAPEQLAVLAGLLGTRTTVRAVLARGQKTWKAWQKTRPNSQVALMTPLLLSAIVRAGASR